ncbi:MAG: hypothetical protein ACK5BN_22305 [Planctomycetota bacterium]
MKALPLAGLLLAGCAAAPPLPPLPPYHTGWPEAAAAPETPRSDALAMPATPGAAAAGASARPAATGTRGH